VDILFGASFVAEEPSMSDITELKTQFGYLERGQNELKDIVNADRREVKELVGGVHTLAVEVKGLTTVVAQLVQQSTSASNRAEESIRRVHDRLDAINTSANTNAARVDAIWSRLEGHDRDILDIKRGIESAANQNITELTTNAVTSFRSRVQGQVMYTILGAVVVSIVGAIAYAVKNVK
jgi:chromosome segregation ATPase